MLTTTVNGLLLGGFYALAALGLSIVFGVLKLINIAHGEFIVGGAYLASVLTTTLGWDAFATLPLVAATVGVIGYVVQRGLLTGLMLNGPAGGMVGTFGLSLLAQGLLLQLFTSTPRSLDTSLGASGMTVLGIQTRSSYAVSFGIAVVLCLLAHVVLTRTRIGTVVRAAAADPSTASLVGIDVRRVYAVTFAVAAAIAAASGVLLGVNFSVTPTTGSQYLLVGIAVVVLGGVGNVLGTVVGALLLGVLQGVAAQLFGGGYRDIAVYLVFFVVLAARPQGLLTRGRGA